MCLESNKRQVLDNYYILVHQDRMTHENSAPDDMELKRHLAYWHYLKNRLVQ